MKIGSLVLLVFLLSFFLTDLLRKYALAKSLLDIPNERSSHAVATPRGGGLAIVIAFFCALAILRWQDLVTWETTLAVFGGGAIVAIVGFMDDHGHIAARWRLLGHAAAAGWILVWVGGLAPIHFFGVIFDFGWIGQLLAVLYLVWMLNLYNFMDGIDGIASVEAVLICLSASLLYWVRGSESLVWMPLLLAVSVAGFLYWNAPPARIFMGDAGSGFLGVMIGLLSLESAWVASEFIWMWLILLGVFIVDATFTLLRRLIRGDKVYEAHRSHAYQFASRRYGRHLPVTVGVAVINIIWLLPIAYGVIENMIDGVMGLVISYIPLILLAFYFRAGSLEPK